MMDKGYMFGVKGQTKKISIYFIILLNFSYNGAWLNGKMEGFGTYECNNGEK